MHLTRFIRDRSDAELLRLCTPGLQWHHLQPLRDEGQALTETCGCLLANTFDLRSWDDYKKAVLRHKSAEDAYMALVAGLVEQVEVGNFAVRREEQQRVGAMITRMAKRELARRDKAVIAEAAKEMDSRDAGRLPALAR